MARRESTGGNITIVRIWERYLALQPYHLPQILFGVFPNQFVIVLADFFIRLLWLIVRFLAISFRCHYSKFTLASRAAYEATENWE
jgi:hypothetical protein